MTRHHRRPASVAARRSQMVALFGTIALLSSLFAAPVAADQPAGLPIRPLSPAAVSVAPAAARGREATETSAPAEKGQSPTTLRPTIQYEEAIAHEKDKIRFTPGARVTVGFSPRAGDRWTVGGHAPRALPAGNASGTEIAASRQGSRWAGGVPKGVVETAIGNDLAPVDAAAVDPATVVEATDTSADVSAVTDSADPLDPGATGLRRQVFGFLPYWELNDGDNTLDYSVLSTIAYFSVGSDKNGNLLKKNTDGTSTTGWGGWASSTMTSVITTAHQNNTRVVLTITMFAWTSNQAANQAALLGSPTARLNLARQAAAAVRDRGADGINLDFEPIATGYGDEFALFVKTMRSELNKIAPGYQLTFDTTGYIGNYPIEAATAAGAADAIFIMGYDYRTAGSNPVGSISPAGGATYDLVDTIKAYSARVPASKLILGVPYYGRAWSTDTDALHAKNISGTKYGASVTVLYPTAVSYAGEYGRRWDSTEKAPYAVYRRENCTSTYGCVTSWRQIYYDDTTSLKAKYDLVNAYNLRGAGIWALGYDDSRTELNAALAEKFLAPTITASSISGSAFSPNGDGTLDTVKVALTATGVSSWGFSAAPVSGGTVDTAVRTASGTGSAPAFTWDGKTNGGTGAADGTYRLTLWGANTAGTKATKTWDVVLDTDAPGVGSSASLPSFSPNADGMTDTVVLSWTLDEAAKGSARIVRSSGGTLTTYRSWSVAGNGSVMWDGRTANGTAVPDGRYLLRVDVRDTAGNPTVRDVSVTVDRTASSLGWSPSLFYPQDRDPYATRSMVSFRLSRAATSSLRVYTQAGAYVKTGWANRGLGSGTWSYTWNGLDGKGNMVPRGWYRVILTTTTWLGTTTMSKLVLVDAFSVVASSWTPAAGQTLTLTFGSSETLKANPTVRFTQAGRSGVTKTATSLGGGRYRVSFTVVAGAPGKASITIAGRDLGGRTNSQTVYATVQ